MSDMCEVHTCHREATHMESPADGVECRVCDGHHAKDVTYLYGSPYRPFWLGFGTRLLRLLGEGAEVEYEDPPRPYLGAMRTNRPIPDEYIAQWELVQLA